MRVNKFALFILLSALSGGCQQSPVFKGTFQIAPSSASLEVKWARNYQLTYIINTQWERIEAEVTGATFGTRTATANVNTDIKTGDKSATLQFADLPIGVNFDLKLRFLGRNSSNELEEISILRRQAVALHPGLNTIELDSMSSISTPDLPSLRMPGPSVTSLASFGPPGRLAKAQAIAVDRSGRLFVFDNSALRMISPDSLGRESIVTIAGRDSNRGTGFKDGSGENALFQAGNTTTGMAFGPDGTLFISDSANHSIRAVKIDDRLQATVTTIAGSGVAGYADGPSNVARFNQPKGICIDGLGNIFIADSGNNCIRKLSFNSTGQATVTTVAGTSSAGMLDGPASAAQFRNPFAVCVTKDGSLFIGDNGNRRVRKISIDPQGIGTVTTLAGRSNSGFVDGPGAVATFGSIQSMCMADENTLYVYDQRLRKLEFDPIQGAVVTTVAGGGTISKADCVGTDANLSLGVGAGVIMSPQGHPLLGTPHTILRIATNESNVIWVRRFVGDYLQADSIPQDGPADYSWSFTPNDFAIDSNGDIFATTFDTFQLIKLPTVLASGTPKVVAGSGNSGFVNGSGSQSEFGLPQDLVISKDGSIFVSDYLNHCVRKITIDADGDATVMTLAGDPTAKGHLDGPSSSARFESPVFMVMSRTGDLLVGDSTDKTIRRISTVNGVSMTSTLAGIPGSSGYVDGPSSIARFASVDGLAEDESGNLYVCDSGNHCIRKVTFDSSGAATVSTFVGGLPGFVDGPLGNARFNAPWDLAYDEKTRILYVLDDYRVRKIDMDQVNPLVSTVAGSDQGYADGSGLSAKFGRLIGMAIDSNGNLILADKDNRVIRKITF